MPTKVIQLIRHAPLDLLKEYFLFLPSTAKLDWNSSNKEILKPLLQIIDELDTQNKDSIATDVERIITMTDNSGQVALSSIIQDRKAFYAMQNIYQKSLWGFLYDYESFKRAEDIRHADLYLKDSTWDGFIGPQNINILANLEQTSAFEKRIKKLFHIDEPVKIEILNRYLTNDYWDNSRSFQIIIHYEGSSVIYKEFIEDEIIQTTIHPIEELVITYDPSNGQINIISKGKECKKAIAKAFVKTLLNSSENQEQISLMRYNLDKLLKPFDFITLPEDGIESVKVLHLSLKEQHNIATFAVGVSIKQQLPIHTAAKIMFKTYDPFKIDCDLIRATLVIHFQPNKDNRSGRRLLINISCPNTCNLKSNSLEDRQIVNKYLKMWELVEE